MTTDPKRAFPLLALVALSLLTGCIGSRHSPDYFTRCTSCVPEFLYPRGEQPVAPTLTRLSLPLRVGIGFVPGTPSTMECGGIYHSFRSDTRNPYRQELSEVDRGSLMSRIAGHFRALPSVAGFVLLPSSSFMPEGGYENLDILAKRKHVDVVVLLSYDQVQRTNSGVLALTYWTLLGAVFIPAEKIETDTMIDAVVIDIASRRMLFRAPGTSNVTSRETPGLWSDRIRGDSTTGFFQAVDDLLPRLEAQLGRFAEKVAENPSEYTVERAP